MGSLTPRKDLPVNTPNPALAVMAETWELVEMQSKYSMGLLGMLLTSQRPFTRDELAALADLPRPIIDDACHDLSGYGVYAALHQHMPHLLSVLDEGDDRHSVRDAADASEAVMCHVYASQPGAPLQEETPAECRVQWGTPDGALHEGLSTGHSAPVLGGRLHMVMYEGDDTNTLWIAGGYVVDGDARPYARRYREARALARQSLQAGAW